MDNRTPENTRGVVNFTLGGAPYTVQIKIAVAGDIEDATGQGIVALVRSFSANTGTARQSAAIIAAAISYNNPRSPVTAKDVLDQMDAEGLLAHMRNATKILTELIRGPEGEKTKK